MKIIFLAPQPFYAERGTPIAVRMTLEVLGHLGYEVDLLVYHEGDDVSIPGLQIVRIPSPPRIRNVPVGPSWKKIICNIWFTIKFLQLVRRNHYDVIHAVEESAYIARLLQRYHKLLYVADIDSSIPCQLEETYSWIRFFLGPFRFIERTTITNACAVLAVSNELARMARESGATCPIHVIEDASLLDPLPTNERRKTHRETLGINPELPIILYVGNLQSYQGIDLLLQAFSRMTRPGVLIVVGGNNKSIERYRQKTIKLKITGCVYWVGPRPLRELEWHLEQADILVSPRTKGVNTPMKIYSYLASGVPILATDIPSHTQVLDDKVAVLTPLDPDIMAKELDHLLGDKSYRFSLGARAKKLADEKYSRNAFHNKVEKFYNQVEEIVQGQTDER